MAPAPAGSHSTRGNHKIITIQILLPPVLGRRIKVLVPVLVSQVGCCDRVAGQQLHTLLHHMSQPLVDAVLRPRSDWAPQVCYY